MPMRRASGTFPFAHLRDGGTDLGWGVWIKGRVVAPLPMANSGDAERVRTVWRKKTRYWVMLGVRSLTSMLLGAQNPSSPSANPRRPRAWHGNDYPVTGFLTLNTRPATADASWGTR